MFSKKQIDFLEEIGVNVAFNSSLSYAEAAEIEQKVSDILQRHGFDENYSPTEQGKMCESILDVL